MPTVKELQERQRYITFANTIEEKYGLPKNILVGVMGTESNFNPNATSPVGARGLMQFMPKTAKEYGINPLNPSQSIDAAGKYLANSYKQFGNWDDALRSYNMGVGGLKQVKAGKKSLPKETQDYTSRVYKHAGIDYSSETPTYANSVAPYINQKAEVIIPQISNFDITPQIATFTPQAEEEVTDKQVETNKNVQDLQQKENERNFLEELYAQAEPKKIEEQVQEQKPIPKTNYTDIYNQISEFVDNPIAQQGGTYKDSLNLYNRGLKTRANLKNVREYPYDKAEDLEDSDHQAYLDYKRTGILPTTEFVGDPIKGIGRYGFGYKKPQPIEEVHSLPKQHPLKQLNSSGLVINNVEIDPVSIDIPKNSPKPTSFNIDYSANRLNNTHGYYDDNNQQNVDIETALRAVEQADAQNNYWQSKYGNSTNPKAIDRLKQLQDNVSITPNFQQGGNISQFLRKPITPRQELPTVQKDNTLVPQPKLQKKLTKEQAKIVQEDLYRNPQKIEGITSGDKAVDFIYNHDWLMDVPVVGGYIKDKAKEIAGASEGAPTVNNTDDTSKSLVYNGDVRNDYKRTPLLDQYFSSDAMLPNSKYKPKDDYLEFLPSYSVKGNFDKRYANKELGTTFEDEALLDVFPDKSTYDNFINNKKPVYSNKESGSNLSNILSVDLGGHKVGAAWDAERNLPYISISDAWDFEPNNYAKKWTTRESSANQQGTEKDKERAFMQSYLMHKAGNPFKVYDRFYFDPKTKKYIPDAPQQLQQGGNISQFLRKPITPRQELPTVQKDNTLVDKLTIPEADKVEDGKDFSLEYIKSPKYRERLINQGYKNVDLEIKNRLKNVEDLKFKDQNGNPNLLSQLYSKLNYEPYSMTGSKYDPFTNKIIIDTTDDRFTDLDLIKTHELGHAQVDRNSKSKLNDKDVEDLFNLQKKYKEDVNFRNKTPTIKDKLNVNSISHDLRPSENKSDLDAYRKSLYDSNIYDAGREDFTKEHLHKSNNNFIKKRLLKNYSEDDLIWIMNNIAQQEGIINQSTQIVQQGGNIVDNFRAEHPSVRDLRTDLLNKRIQEHYGKIAPKNNIQKDNTNTIKPKIGNVATQKEIDKRADEENKNAYENSIKQASKDYVEKNMGEVYQHPLWSLPGTVTPEGVAIMAMQGATKITPDLYNKDYKSAGMDALMMLPLAPGATKAISPAIKNAGKLLGTEEGLLSNTYKLNPLSFKPSPEAYYRTLGKEGIDDAFSSGVIRPKQTSNIYSPELGKRVDANVPEFPEGSYFNKGSIYSTKKMYNPDYIAEVVGKDNLFTYPERTVFNENIRISPNNIPIEEATFYKKDWLQGYKEVPKSESNPFINKLQGIEKKINDIQIKEASVNSKLNDLTSQYKNKIISADVFSKKAKELNLADLTYKKGELEKLKREYMVQKDIYELPQENILRDENQLGINISDGGSNNKGVFEVGDKYVAKLNAHGYDDASRLLAYKDKIKSNRISKTVQVKDFDGKVYQVQEKVVGIPISKMTELELSNIPKKHIDNFWKDKKELDNLGLSIDISGGKSNIIYDKNKGFQFIDLGIGKSPDSKIINEVFPVLKLQQGGTITDNEKAFLEKLKTLPVSKYGMYEFPNQKVIVPSSDITMKNIPHKILGISLETGEKKMMLPEKEYKFVNTKNVLEIPKK
jgi:membrane-bound lytic murein transglycosylase MltF